MQNLIKKGVFLSLVCLFLSNFSNIYAMQDKTLSANGVISALKNFKNNQIIEINLGLKPGVKVFLQNDSGFPLIIKASESYKKKTSDEYRSFNFKEKIYLDNGMTERICVAKWVPVKLYKIVDDNNTQIYIGEFILK